MFGNPQKSRIIACSAVFIALIALGGWISVPLGIVPFTLQTLFVLLAGTVMHRSAVIPAGAYLLLGAMGLPLFHNGIAGPGILLGPTGGYLMGFIPAALAAGFAYEHESPPLRIFGLFIATMVVYACGILWLMYSLGMDLLPALAGGVLPFLAGDAIKGSAAYLIARRLPP